MTTTITCPLCGNSARLAYSGHKGYQAPMLFDIYECASCESSHAQPLATNSQIYELIYRNADRIPGYERYARYRELLKKSNNPLDVLCSQEDVYWAIREALTSIPPHCEGLPLKVLEIGSGFGYLTYALRRAGYDCTGIDISATAVSRARDEFGDFYAVSDLHTLTLEQANSFDVVVATELIEHVEDPSALLADAAKLLRETGRLIVTTPNRDLYSSRYVWNTDPPPVHLWWFSRTSLHFLAWQLGMKVCFVDFGPFYGKQNAPERLETKPPTFAADGTICFRDSALRNLARKAVARMPGLFRPLARLLLTALTAGKAKDHLFRHSLSLCAVLQVGRRIQ